ncbi:MAG: helix-turn-helix transcriptional regulator [Clostridia bacterium]|nr:helix-turn-helix transcriptional regulator [Clostridia bacterium]
MRPYGPGILPESQIYFYDAAPAEKRMFFYALCVGHYLCGADYIVDRQSYNSYLLLYVKRGAAWCRSRSQKLLLPAGSFALIDCYHPHRYGADEPCELYWVHFDGPTAADVCRPLLKGGAPLPQDPEKCSRVLTDLYDMTAARGPLEAAVVNRMLVVLLTEFLVNIRQKPSAGNEVIEEVRRYILENPDKDLTLGSLARRANLSPYHFARTFKREVGVSPHDFLINARLNLARFYLMSSGDTVKQIAYNCGFSSEAGFCTAFRSRLGMTPTEFRRENSLGR